MGGGIGHKLVVNSWPEQQCLYPVSGYYLPSGFASLAYTVFNSFFVSVLCLYAGLRECVGVSLFGSTIFVRTAALSHSFSTSPRQCDS